MPFFSKRFTNVFGWRIGRRPPVETTTPIVLPPNPDAAIQLVQGSVMFNSYIIGRNTDPTRIVQEEIDLINRYREMSLNVFVSAAIDEITNEAIVQEAGEPVVTINFDEETSGYKISEELKKQINKEFKNILRLLDFNNQAVDLFKTWYIDGKLIYQTLIDVENPLKGILETRYIDPRCIKKVENFIKSRDSESGVEIIEGQEEVYIYNPNGLTGTSVSGGQGINISVDSIVMAHSGKKDKFNTQILSYLYPAIRPYNQLVQMEDMLVINRIVRSPERRIFNVDVNNLPPQLADQYVQQMATDYKNKINYNSETGEIKDDRRFVTATEDFWFAKRSDGRGSEVTTLQSNVNFDEMNDVLYFQKVLYKALNIPVTRLDPEKGFNLGRSADITREEVKFSKFVNKLRSRFSILFDELLKRQLVLKKITTEADWNELKEAIYYDFNTDNHFTELKKLEIMKERFDVAGNAKDFVEEGYVDKDYIRIEILGFSQEEVDKDKVQEPQPEETQNPDEINNKEGQVEPSPVEPSSPTEPESEGEV